MCVISRILHYFFQVEQLHLGHVFESRNLRENYDRMRVFFWRQLALKKTKLTGKKNSSMFS